MTSMDIYQPQVSGKWALWCGNCFMQRAITQQFSILSQAYKPSELYLLLIWDFHPTTLMIHQQQNLPAKKETPTKRKPTKWCHTSYQYIAMWIRLSWDANRTTSWYQYRDCIEPVGEQYSETRQLNVQPWGCLESAMVRLWTGRPDMWKSDWARFSWHM